VARERDTGEPVLGEGGKVGMNRRFVAVRMPTAPAASRTSIELVGRPRGPDAGRGRRKHPTSSAWRRLSGGGRHDAANGADAHSLVCESGGLPCWHDGLCRLLPIAELAADPFSAPFLCSATDAGRRSSSWPTMVRGIGFAEAAFLGQLPVLPVRSGCDGPLAAMVLLAHELQVC